MFWELVGATTVDWGATPSKKSQRPIKTKKGGVGKVKGLKPGWWKNYSPWWGQKAGEKSGKRNHISVQRTE